jgi:hypothetical protein
VAAGEECGEVGRREDELGILVTHYELVGVGSGRVVGSGSSIFTAEGAEVSQRARRY